MKRSVFLCLIMSLLFVSLVYAADAGTSAVDSSNAGKDTLKQTAADAGSNLKNLGQNLTGSLNDRTENLLEREVVIPSWLEGILGIDKNIKLQYLIILISIWIMVFIVILSVIDFVPLFGGKMSKFLASIAIMLLLSISGALKEVSMFFFDFWNMFSVLEEWSFWKLVLAIFLSVIILIGALWLRKKIKKDVILTTAEIKGKEAGAGIAILSQNYQQTKDEAGG